MAIISDETAKAFINHFRSTLPEGEIKSLWMDRNLIDTIRQLDGDTAKLSGLRIYLARYKDGVGITGEAPFTKNRFTVVVVPTVNEGGDLERDIPGAYMDTALPCPPRKCDGGI